MPKTDDGQYELVLENRQVLGIFFVAAVLCGVFFALGYIVGKNTGGAYTAPSPAAAGTPAGTNEGKRSALAPAQQAAPTTPANAAAATPAPEEQPAAIPAAPAAEPAPVAAAEASLTLQVAALSKKEDADAMVALLKSKNFAVSIVQGATDKLYHVLVGPFATVKEAEAVKGKLENEGFKPLVKR